MKRREFLTKTGLAAGGILTLASCVNKRGAAKRVSDSRRIQWKRESESRLFSAVSWDGVPLVLGTAPRLLAGGCRLLDEASAQTTWLTGQQSAEKHGPLRVELRHQLRDSGSGLDEDLLEATLTVRNVSGQPQRVELAFATSVQPSQQVEAQQIYIPLNAAGAKAAIYLHPVLFDDATPFFHKMRDSVLVDAAGKMVPFPWQGPDTKGKNWRASLASPEWREHLLQQAQWIMEILQPDAITVDETFAGLGYDYHPNHAGPTSTAAIDFYRKLRALVHSFGGDKAVFTSDCSMSPFILWADGECGDHAYPNLLGHPLYTQEPVRYLAALGDKPWRPCAWHFQHTWGAQMKLARQVGAGVGVSNGWIEYTGLVRLPAEVKSRMLRDIQSLIDRKNP